MNGDLVMKLLNDYQRNFPLKPEPFAEIAAQLGISEGDVMSTLSVLTEDGTVSRVGAVVRPGAMGASTLAAMAVPENQLDAIAAMISAYPEVNHNYQREHRLNLWFVLTAADRERIDWVLADIEDWSGIEVVDLPMVESYRLDLGFGFKREGGA